MINILKYEKVKNNYIDRGFYILNDDGEYLVAFENNKEDEYVVIHKFAFDDRIETIQLFYEEVEELFKEIFK